MSVLDLNCSRFGDFLLLQPAIKNNNIKSCIVSLCHVQCITLCLRHNDCTVHYMDSDALCYLSDYCQSEININY